MCAAMHFGVWRVLLASTGVLLGNEPNPGREAPSCIRPLTAESPGVRLFVTCSARLVHHIK
jgi:hypothetical protein